MLKVGITGGIGSGKTTVCRLFEVLGIPTYYADDRAKSLMVNDLELVDALKNAFGKEIYTSAGALNREHLAALVFSDSKKIALLNSLVHPAVARDSAQWHAAQQAPYTLKEAALLYEAGSDRELDKVITVFAPENMRIERVKKRNGWSEEQVRARINNQLPDLIKCLRADYILFNDGRGIIEQVFSLHHKLLNYSSL